MDHQGLGEGRLEAELLGDGHSNLTYRLSRGDADFVLRRPPRPPFAAGTHDVLREARILRMLAGSTVPVANIRAVCSDPEVLGVPFYISDFIRGSVLGQGAFGAPPDLNPLAIANTLAAGLAGVHAVPLAATGLDSIGRSSGYVERQLRTFARLTEVEGFRNLERIERLERRLRTTRPPDPTATLTHGDYRLGNVMFSPQSEIVAVLDWELSTLGDPLSDLGWMSALWAEPGDPGALVKLSPATAGLGWPGRSTVIDAYAAAAGREPREIGWYMAFALWKFCVIMERNYLRAAAGQSEDAFALDLGGDLAELLEFAEQTAAA